MFAWTEQEGGEMFLSFVMDLDWKVYLVGIPKGKVNNISEHRETNSNENSKKLRKEYS